MLFGFSTVYCLVFLFAKCDTFLLLGNCQSFVTFEIFFVFFSISKIFRNFFWRCDFFITSGIFDAIIYILSFAFCCLYEEWSESIRSFFLWTLDPFLYPKSFAAAKFISKNCKFSFPKKINVRQEKKIFENVLWKNFISLFSPDCCLVFSYKVFKLKNFPVFICFLCFWKKKFFPFYGHFFSFQNILCLFFWCANGSGMEHVYYACASLLAEAFKRGKSFIFCHHQYLYSFSNTC